jgi:hypothetical protein
MLVDPKDGTCRKCGGTLEVLEGDDATMTVQCTECDDSYLVEPDAFGDGAMDYYPRIMLKQILEKGEE